VVVGCNGEGNQEQSFQSGGACNRCHVSSLKVCKQYFLVAKNWFFYSSNCLCCSVLFANSEFGAKVVPPKRILKMLPELFDHQDQNVRASSKGLTLELCRWIGKDPVKSILLEKMRDTMVQQIYSLICMTLLLPSFYLYIITNISFLLLLPMFLHEEKRIGGWAC